MENTTVLYVLYVHYGLAPVRQIQHEQYKKRRVVRNVVLAALEYTSRGNHTEAQVGAPMHNALQKF